MLPIWTGLFICFYIILRKLGRKKLKPVSKSNRVLIANSQRITSLTNYQLVYSRYKKIFILLSIVTLIGGLSAIFVSARPSQTNFVEQQQKNRDIMLCLDVSGSMMTVDKQLLETFLKLVKNLKGQRIGLTNFNTSSATIFPLNDDYTLIEESLTRGVAAFESLEKDKISKSVDLESQTYKDIRFMLDGTTTGLVDYGSSLAGTGLAQCIQRMGGNEEKRSQSIIFATDNDVYGKELITLSQATNLAKKQEIRVYPIDPIATNATYKATDQEKISNELKQVATLTGGKYSTTRDVSVGDIVAEISSREATLYGAPPERVETDTPWVFIITITLTIIVMVVIAWRWRL